MENQGILLVQMIPSKDIRQNTKLLALYPDNSAIQRTVKPIQFIACQIDVNS